jgi:hypothetical protein
MPDTSDLSVEDNEPLVIESVTWLDGSAVERERRGQSAGFVARATARLTVPGVVALLGGVATLWCFLLPWFVVPTGLLDGQPSVAETRAEPAFVTISGWSIASGMPLQSNVSAADHVALFIHLWLIPLAVAGLFVVAWCAAQRRIAARPAAGCVLALSALALLVELGYDVQVTSFAQFVLNGVSVGWGFWLAVIVSLTTGAFAANLLRPAAVSSWDAVDREAE